MNRITHPAVTLIAPAIGTYWEGQGGVYRGLTRGTAGAPDQHIIEAVERLDDDHRKDWKGCIAWAAGLTVDGHSDFTLPTRREASLLFANRDEDCDGGVHWTSEATDASFAWYCNFTYGFVDDLPKSYEGRARAVRRVAVQSFNPSVA